jgi:hypothetical protein
MRRSGFVLVGLTILTVSAGGAAGGQAGESARDTSLLEQQRSAIRSIGFFVGHWTGDDCQLTGRGLLCERRDGADILNRVTIGVDEAGRWVERGERSRDGATWTTYFETEMSRT